jgi:hypothetical protein
MRELGLPLDYQVEDGTLVITAALPTVQESPAGSADGTGTGGAAASVADLPWFPGRPL